jgi:hypothetical protein
MAFHSNSAGDFFDSLEQWLMDNNHTSADSRISLANLLSKPPIQTLQRQHSIANSAVLDLLQRHPRRVQVGDAHTKSPWVYSITQVQHRPVQAQGASAGQDSYLAERLLPHHNVPNPSHSASIVLYAPSHTPGCLSVLMAQSKNGKFGFVGGVSQTYEKTLFETAQRGFDEATGGVLQEVDAKSDRPHLTHEVARAATGAHGRVIWNKDAALFPVPLSCLPGAKSDPSFLPTAHRHVLQHPDVPPEFKRKLALAWCELRWNDASQTIAATIAGSRAALADWTIADLQCEPFKEWFKQSVGLATRSACAQPAVPPTAHTGTHCPAAPRAHHPAAQPAMMPHATSAANPASTPCKFFEAGFCKKGQSCAFKHAVAHSSAPAPSAAPSAPTVTPLIGDLVAAAAGVHQDISTRCMKKPKEERLLACAERLQSLTGIVTAVISGSTAVGPGDLVGLDKLFTIVSDSCLLLLQIADELDRSQERRAFICNCNDLADKCESERGGMKARLQVAAAAAAQPVCKHSGCLMPGQGRDGLCRMHGG